MARGTSWTPPGRPAGTTRQQKLKQKRRARRRVTDRFVALVVVVLVAFTGLIAALTLSDEIATDVQGRLIERENPSVPEP